MSGTAPYFVHCRHRHRVSGGATGVDLALSVAVLSGKVERAVEMHKGVRIVDHILKIGRVLDVPRNVVRLRVRWSAQTHLHRYCVLGDCKTIC
eukprot:SAG11_NODE_1450_length_4883_cov_2.373955_7_plen_93_part_00